MNALTQEAIDNCNKMNIHFIVYPKTGYDKIIIFPFMKEFEIIFNTESGDVVMKEKDINIDGVFFTPLQAIIHAAILDKKVA